MQEYQLRRQEEQKMQAQESAQQARRIEELQASAAETLNRMKALKDMQSKNVDKAAYQLFEDMKGMASLQLRSEVY